MKKVFTLALIFGFLFSFLVLNVEVQAQRGGGSFVSFAVGSLFQPSNAGNDPFLNANPVSLGNDMFSLIGRSNFAVPKLQSEFLQRPKGIFIRNTGGRMLPLNSLTRKKMRRDFNKRELTRAAPNVIPTDKSVGIIRELSLDGISSGVITHVNLVAVLLKSPDFLGEDFEQFVSSLSLNNFNGSTVSTVVSVSTLAEPPIKKVITNPADIKIEGLSTDELRSIATPHKSMYDKSTFRSVQYSYQNVTVLQMLYPDMEDAPGFVDFVTTRDPFNYFLYLVSFTLPQPISIPSSTRVGFGIRAGEVGNGDFLLTIGKNFYQPEDQDGFIVYFNGNTPLFFETSYGPLCADHLCDNAIWPAYTRANIQIVGKKLVR